MNRLLILLLFILMCGLVSCSGTGDAHKKVNAVEKTDSCKVNPKNRYEVYIPERNRADEKLPLLIIIDAHGSGQFALDKFKKGANQYPVILVASDYIKNGFVNYESAIQTLIDDARQKYPAGKTIFMAGFSGGARMALGYALTHQPDGLVLCGALANASQINALYCPVISISGMDDFNFVETAQYLFQDKTIPKNLKIELTNASHNWPDNQMLANALGFLRLSCQNEDISSPTKAELNVFEKRQEDRIDSLKNRGEFLKAALIARNMSTTSTFNSDKSFTDTYQILKKNPLYIHQLSKLKNTLNFEMKARQPYLNAFSTKDSLWWKNEIQTINTKIKTEQDSFQVDMYRRIKGFWGIACYSLGNQAINSHNAEMLNKIIPVYRMLEPENSYVYYFSAFPYFWKGNNDETIEMLKKARQEGFSEMSRLKNDFPESIISKL